MIVVFNKGASAALSVHIKNFYTSKITANSLPSPKTEKAHRSKTIFCGVVDSPLCLAEGLQISRSHNNMVIDILHYQIYMRVGTIR